MNYKLSTKKENGKWWSWGNVKENQWGKLQASFKVTPELIALFQSHEGKWINFAMFEEKDEAATSMPTHRTHASPANPFSADEPLPF